MNIYCKQILYEWILLQIKQKENIIKKRIVKLKLLGHIEMVVESRGCVLTRQYKQISMQLAEIINQIVAWKKSDDEMWIIKKLIKEQPDNATIGLLLGNQSSQWFALLYLNKDDHYIKEQLEIKNYVRYMDDMILIHREKKHLSICKNKIEDFCKNKLNLKVELNAKTQIGKVKNGIDFLGFRLILTETGKVVKKLRGSSKIRLKRYLKNLKKLEKKGVIDKEYVNIRRNSFASRIKRTDESRAFLNKIMSE